MSGHPYHQPQDGRQQHHHMQQQQQHQHQHQQHQQHQHQQHQHQQPQYYGQQQPYYGGGGGGGQFVHGTFHVQSLPMMHQQQQQHNAYGHGYGYPQQHYASNKHRQPPPSLPQEEEDLAMIEAEIRSVVESALSTPSLLRGAGAASGNGGGGYNHKSHHKRQHKQQQQPALLEKFSGGGVAVDEVCRLPAVKRLAQGDKALVLRALEASELLVLAGAGKQQRVGRKDSGADLPYRCVVLTRLPGDKANEAGVRGMVAPYGAVGCVVILGGGAAEEGGDNDVGAGEGEREATAAGRAMLEAKAVVEFVEGKAAVKCVEAMWGGSNWRRGSRAEFACGVSLAQAAKHFGVELTGSGGGESGASANGGGGGGSSSTAAAGSASSSSAAMPASVLGARLPPTFSEGTHTGVVMEMALVSTEQPPSEEGATAVQRGVIKREGRVRSQISFELPAAEVPADVAVGARVDFVVRHVEGRACIVGVGISTAPPLAAPLRFTNSTKKEAAGGGAAPFVQAKGPDERGGMGFLLPRTKPSEEIRGLLESMKQLKVAAKSG